jgi:hypothetical protein
MKTEGEAGRGSGCMASGAGVWPTRGVFGVTISTSGGGISSRLFLQRTCIGGPFVGQSGRGLAILWGGEAWQTGTTIGCVRVHHAAVTLCEASAGLALRE